MNQFKDLKYWFTSEGGDEYETILNSYYKQIITKAKSHKIINKSGYDILKLQDYPEKDTHTFLTKGLSTFILGNQNDGYIRREHSMTIDSKYSDLRFDIILDHISQQELEMRKPYERDVIISLPNSLLCKLRINPNLNMLYFAGAIWFDDQFQGFFGEINTNICEVLLVSVIESNLIRNSVDNFIELCQTGKIDILDLNRGKYSLK